MSSSSVADDENDESTTCGGGLGLVAASNEKEQQQEQIAQKEQEAVTWLRLVVLLVLVASAIVVSVALSLYTSKKEEDEFKSQYESDAFKLMEAIGQHLDLTLGAADAFVYKIISYAQYSNNTFPYVTMPNYASQAAKMMSSSTAFYVGIYHSVKNEERLKWENYMADPNNNKFVEDGLRVQAKDPNWHGTSFEGYTKLDSIWGDLATNGGPYPYNDTTDPYLVQFQNYPVLTIPGFPVYGWNVRSVSYYDDAIMHGIKTKSVSMTKILNLVDDPTDEYQVFVAQIHNNWTANYLSSDDDSSEPEMEMFYPMYNSVEDVQIDVDNPDLGPAVGALFFATFIRDFIRDILPPNSIGIIVVFRNTLGQVFTYRIDGADTTFLGSGDHHEAKYDDMAHSAKFSDLSGGSSGRGSSIYTGLPLDTEYNEYEITIYPSQDMEDRYITSEPILLAVGAFLIFLFTSAVFLLYDMCVARRQRIIKKRAMASGAIVNSLFPEKVRDKLYEEQQPVQEQARNKNSFVASMVPIGSTGEGDPTVAALTSPASGKPIADLFEAASVFFADIVGFTKWSSSRSPTEVFELLETIYGAFDVVAKRRRVFKVETIGDCYVAVTGIPNPQADHAVILVKFARDCMMRMRQVLEELVGTLGVDTRDLDMRVGIHSGPVTAGVLRGEKGRFQLFGDSVNTASRMESNGQPGMIHVSQATADELTKSGKASWLRPREEKITAKGKGEMQTYFVSVAPGRTSLKSSGESTVLTTSSVFHNEVEGRNQVEV